MKPVKVTAENRLQVGKKNQVNANDIGTCPIRAQPSALESKQQFAPLLLQPVIQQEGLRNSNRPAATAEIGKLD